MIRHAIVDTSTNIVVNLIDYDSDISGTIPPGMETPMLAIMSDTADIGWHYQSGKDFINPNKPPMPSPVWSWGPKFVDVMGSGNNVG